MVIVIAHVDSHHCESALHGPMSCLAWNWCGIGNLWSVHVLHDILKTQGPRFVFLFETKVTVRKMEATSRRSGFSGYIAVNRIGFGGGLALLWKADIQITLLSYLNITLMPRLRQIPEISGEDLRVFMFTQTGQEKFYVESSSCFKGRKFTLVGSGWGF